MEVTQITFAGVGNSQVIGGWPKLCDVFARKFLVSSGFPEEHAQRLERVLYNQALVRAKIGIDQPGGDGSFGKADLGREGIGRRCKGVQHGLLPRVDEVGHGLSVHPRFGACLEYQRAVVG